MGLYDERAPGVYIEEVAGGARPIQAVGTSTAGFLGVAPKADAHVLQPFPITNWTQFKKEFCNGAFASSDLARGVHGFFLNGGSRCYVVNLGDSSLGSLEKGLAALKRIDDVAIVAAPGYTGDSYETIMAHCENMKDRVAILDAPAEITENDIDKLKVAYVSSGKSFTVPAREPGAYLPEGVSATKKGNNLILTGKGSKGETVKILRSSPPVAAATQGDEGKPISSLQVSTPGTGGPALISSTDPGANPSEGVAVVQAVVPVKDSPKEAVKGQNGSPMVIAAGKVDADGKWMLTLPFPEEGEQISILQYGEMGVKPRPSQYATFYFPWILVRDPLLPVDTRLYTPPSGHIAGVWARTDASRGVHKAPANEPLRGALGVQIRLTDAEQGGLNQAGVNCIRFFAQEGIVVWGARTLAPNGEWRYLNVRRLFNMIEESIQKSTRWIVFEPNDETLWKAIHRDVTAFLTRVWRTGALMGSTPDQAFFVKCDAETNPPEEIDAGKVTIVIGIAPVKPAEFVVFQISQLAAGAQIAESGG